MEENLHAIQSQENLAWRVTLKRHLIATGIYVATVLTWIYMSADMPTALKVFGLIFFILLFTTFMILDLKKTIDLFFPVGRSMLPEVNASTRLDSMDDREGFISKWESFLARRDSEEQELERSFNPDEVESYPVNIWDDFADGDDTYAYVESSKIPSSVDFKVLNHLMQFAETLDLVKGGRIKLRMSFHDSAVKYPWLVGNRDAQFCLYRRWELIISCPNHEVLEELVEQLAKVPDFQGKKIDVYSES